MDGSRLAVLGLILGIPSGVASGVMHARHAPGWYIPLLTAVAVYAVVLVAARVADR